MSNVAIFYISFALNINFNYVKGFRDTKICKKSYIPRSLEKFKKCNMFFETKKKIDTNLGNGEILFNILVLLLNLCFVKVDLVFIVWTQF